MYIKEQIDSASLKRCNDTMKQRAGAKQHWPFFLSVTIV